jgi:hypothetical protein
LVFCDVFPKPVDFRKSIDGLAALIKLGIKVAVFNFVLFAFLKNSHLAEDLVLGAQLLLCSAHLESERFEASPYTANEAIVLTVQELNWLSDGFDPGVNTLQMIATTSRLEQGPEQITKLTIPAIILSDT